MAVYPAYAVEQPVELTDQLNNSLFRQLLGHWQIKDQTRDASGQWLSGPGASWHFYPIFNGHAIQDEWVSPPINQPAPEKGRQYGTNIRIYNFGEHRWEMAWMSVKGQQIDTFQATEHDQQIVMTGLFNGQPSRITFFAIKAQSFQWKLEYRNQATEQWQEVYRIQGIRAVKAP